MRDEAVYILINIVKSYAYEHKEIDPKTERNIIGVGLKALRILGVSTEELVTATTSIMLEDSPIDLTINGQPKRPTQDLKTMLKDMLDLTALNNSRKESKN